MDVVADLTGFFGGFITFLKAIESNPLEFSVVFFIYTILATVILPIPVEAALFFSMDHTPFYVKALLLGLGKMVGAALVFKIGDKIGDTVKGWSEKWGWFNWIVRKCEWLVEKTGYVGIYLILSIPIMTDTVPLYIFSIFNEKVDEEGKPIRAMKWNRFAVVCFLAGVTRAMVVYTVFWTFHIKL